MGSAIIATVGSFLAMTLSILWMLVLFAPMTWFWTENGIITIELSLQTMWVSKGTMGTILYISASVIDSKMAEALKELMTHQPSVEDGTMHLCTPVWETFFKWCDSWMLAKHGSLLMFVFGIFTALLLAVGGASSYYYNSYHSTKTGRYLTIGCLSTAVALNIFAMFMYLVLTIQTGYGTVRFGMEANFMYGPGLMLAVILTILTVVPLYMQLRYAKKWGDEWDGRNAEDDLAPYEAGMYGGVASNAGYGYGATGTGHQQVPQQQQYAPQQAHYPMPGSGMAAW